MLKIKEDKMQDLEKFGFKKFEYNDEISYCRQVYSNYCFSYIEIEVMQDRRITLNIDCNGIRTDKLDIFLELFANDMIEKVEE